MFSRSNCNVSVNPLILHKKQGTCLSPHLHASPHLHPALEHPYETGTSTFCTMETWLAWVNFIEKYSTTDSVHYENWFVRMRGFRYWFWKRLQFHSKEASLLCSFDALRHFLERMRSELMIEATPPDQITDVLNRSLSAHGVSWEPNFSYESSMCNVLQNRETNGTFLFEKGRSMS